MSPVGLLLLLALATALAAVVLIRRANPIADVADVLHSSLPVDVVDPMVLSLLRSSPKVEIESPLPGTHTLSYRSWPLVAVLLAIFLFPLGLLMLLFVHVDRSLTVTITPDGEGSRIQVFGRVHVKLARALGRAVRIQLDAASRRV